MLRILATVGLVLAFAAAALAADETPAIQPTPSGVSTAGVSADAFHSPDPQLRQLIEILLAENPDLDSRWARSRSRLQSVPQARSLPDPQLTYRYFAETPETRVGPQVQSLEIGQGIPWGGKRRLQAERAELLASSSTWEAEDAQRTLVAELKQTYFEAAYLQEALAVNSEERELLRRFESIALTRYATGEGIQQNVIKIQTDVSRLDDRETELRERLDVVGRRIARLIGRSDSSPALNKIRLEIPDVRYDRDELERASVAGHPKVRVVERRIEADRLWSRRRTLESRPDFRVGVGYTQVDKREDAAGTLVPPEDNGKDIVGITLGINIPLYRKRIRAGTAEVDESLRANEDHLRSVRDRLRFEIQEATLRLESIAERGRLYRDVIIPQAEESLASAEAAYATNRVGFLDLVEAERILFQARLAYHRLVSDHWIALADLELALGGPFPVTAPPAAADPTGSTS